MTLSALLPRAELRSALAVAMKIVERRTTIPILSNVALIGGMVRATDLDIQVTCTLPNAVADDAFSGTLPCAVLRDVEKKAPATEHLAIDFPERPKREPKVDGETKEDREARESRNAAVERGYSGALDFEGLRVTLDALPISDFPEMKIEGAIQGDFTLPTSVLRDALQAVALAISTEETRYYLNGVYLHVTEVDGAPMLRVVATDGHRMARHDVGSFAGMGAGWGVIVPRKTVAFMLGLAKAKGAPETVHVMVNTAKARFTIGTVEVITKLVDGTFPDYQRVIPSGNDKRVLFERAALIKAIGAVMTISSERGRAVKIALRGEDGARLSVVNPDAGRADIDVEVDTVNPGDALPVLEIGFNASYLLDILGEIDAETVEFALADPGSPTLIREREGAATLYVLMPLRV